MVSQTLLASAGFTLITGAIYAYIGYRLNRRKTPQSGKLAAAGFTVFWFGLALSAVLGATGLQAFLAAFDYLDLGVVLILTQIGLLAISLALWGLLYYLVYLYTGRRDAWIPIAIFYVLFYGFLQYFIWDAGPNALRADRWSVVVEYEKDIENLTIADPYILALIVGLLVPQMVASIAYLTLAFRVRNPTQRYRIMLVSLSILAWFGSPLVAVGLGLSESDNYQFISRLIGLAAAVTIFLAYHPPGFIRRKYGIASLADEEQPREDVPYLPKTPEGGMAAVRTVT